MTFSEFVVLCELYSFHAEDRALTSPPQRIFGARPAPHSMRVRWFTDKDSPAFVCTHLEEFARQIRRQSMDSFYRR